MTGEHVHQFGPVERSRFAGTVRRKCLVEGCKVVSLDDDETDQDAAEWSGGLCPVAPDTCWIDDVTEEHVCAYTGKRTSEHPPDPEAMKALIREAVAAWADDFDTDNHINGADLVEWFSGWRQRARAVVERCGADAGVFDETCPACDKRRAAGVSDG